MSGITESVVEEACLEWFRALGYSTAYGPEIGPDGSAEERSSWEDVVLVERLRDAILRINPDLPRDAADHALATVLRAESQNTMAENFRVHRLLTEGVPVEHRVADGSIRHSLVWLVDFERPENNDWLVVHQFTVVQAGKHRRPDVAGLPDLRALSGDDGAGQHHVRHGMPPCAQGRAGRGGVARGKAAAD